MFRDMDMQSWLDKAEVEIGCLSRAVLGYEGARQFFKLYVTAFPDLHVDTEQILPAGDSHVVGRWRSKGTHDCWHGPS